MQKFRQSSTVIRTKNIEIVGVVIFKILISLETNILEKSNSYGIFVLNILEHRQCNYSLIMVNVSNILEHRQCNYSLIMVNVRNIENNAK